MAHVTCLAAARHAVYERVGLDLPARGLPGRFPPRRRRREAPRDPHAALRLLGIGEAQEIVLRVDREGRITSAALRDALGSGGPTIVCARPER